MDDINNIISHASDPSAPAFQEIKHLTRYLDGFPHCAIMYPDGLDSTTTHELCQEFYPLKFNFQRICNGISAFAYGV